MTTRTIMLDGGVLRSARREQHVPLRSIAEVARVPQEVVLAVERGDRPVTPAITDAYLRVLTRPQAVAKRAGNRLRRYTREAR